MPLYVIEFLLMTCRHLKIMKSPILPTVCFFLCCSLGLWSQPRQGSWLLSGSIQNSVPFNSEISDFNTSWMPTGLYYLSDRLALGGTAGFGLNVKRGTDAGFVIIPEARYHFSRPGSIHQFFIAGSSGITIATDGPNTTLLQLGLGYDYFLQPDIALETNLAYANTWTEGDSYKDFSLRAGFSLFLHPEEGISEESGTVWRGSGSWLLGGTSAGIRLISPPDEMEVFQINLQPNAALFVTDRLALGGKIPLNLSFSNNNDLFEAGLLPLVRYYLSGAANRYQWFAEAQGGWIRRKSNFTAFNDQLEVDGNSYQFFAGLGLNYFLRPGIALEGNLRYAFLEDHYEDDFGQFTRNNSRLHLDVGLQFFLRPGPD